MIIMKAISLFSGGGGDTSGMQEAGVDVVAYSEILDIAQQTHELNFKNTVLMGKEVKGDITKTKNEELRNKYENVDLIFAGFPCQGFSKAGKKQQDDPRNTLFKEFVRVVNEIQPRYIIGENVKGLLTRKTSSNEKYIDVIQQSFETIGYKTIFKICNLTDYGVPQKRERLIILGTRHDIQPVSFPSSSLSSSSDLSLVNIVSFDMTGAIQITKDMYDMENKIPEECIITDLENTETTNHPHPYLVMKANTKNATYNNIHYTSLLSFGKRDSPIHCEIINIQRPSKTIICTYDHQPRLFVPLKNKNGYFLRCLLPYELKQIQGFQKDYNFKGNIKQQILQIGNAIPPPIVCHITKHILAHHLEHTL